MRVQEAITDNKIELIEFIGDLFLEVVSWFALTR